MPGPPNATTGRPFITCECRPPQDCPNRTSSVCRTNRQCYRYKHRNLNTGRVEESLGCYSNDKEHHLMFCRTKVIPNHAIACCDSNMCNSRLDPQFPPDDGTGVQPGGPGGLSSAKPTVFAGPPFRLIMAIVVPLFLLMFILGLMGLLWRFVLRPRLKQYALKASSGAGKAKSACASVTGPRDLLLLAGPSAGAPAVSYGAGVDGSSSLRAQHVGESTLQRLYDISCSSGSGSGLPFLVQRTVARQVSLVECIGKGRYGEVWRGDYHGEAVAVKIFSSREEASWSRETEMYNTLLLRHENILGYLASDMTSRYGCTQLWLITHYHPLGSLYDYLGARVVTAEAGLSLMFSAAAGLCHLHTEIFGCQGKPGIAHRDVKSKNILVRLNGACCIADLGLSVTYSQTADELSMGHGPAAASPGQLPNNKVGTKRYMSPEILLEAHAQPGISRAATFELLKAADVYALALVLWEVCRRCVTDGVADEYLIPFSGRVPADPTYEQMKTVVCDRNERPPCSPRWAAHRGLARVTRVLAEAWHAQPDVRLSSLRVKKTLGSLLEESQKARRDRLERTRAAVPATLVEVGTTDGLRETARLFSESSCEEASVSFCGSSSHSSNSLVHKARPTAAPAPDLSKARLPGPGGQTNAGLELASDGPGPDPSPEHPLGPPAGPGAEGTDETTEPSSVKLLLPRAGRGSCDSDRLMSSSEDSAAKKAIINQLMA